MRQFLAAHVWLVTGIWVVASILLLLTVAVVMRDRREQLVWDGPFVNVRDFGAKGDGKTDDTEAVNRAFSALSNGGTLYFPRGTYRVSTSIEKRQIDDGEWVIQNVKMLHPR